MTDHGRGTRAIDPQSLWGGHTHGKLASDPSLNTLNDDIHDNEAEDSEEDDHYPNVPREGWLQMLVNLQEQQSRKGGRSMSTYPKAHPLSMTTSIDFLYQDSPRGCLTQQPPMGASPPQGEARRCPDISKPESPLLFSVKARTLRAAGIQYEPDAKKQRA
jgi:hypothetical protein